jgi:FG-GAP-like repeat
MRIRRFFFVAPVLVVFGAASCSDDDSGAGGAAPGTGGTDAGDASAGTGGTSGGGTGGSGGTSLVGGSGGTTLDGSAGGCSEDCGDGRCIDEQCCEALRACGDVCCSQSDVCSFNECVTIGAVCTDSEDCATGEYCEPSLGEEDADAGDAGGTCTIAAAPTGRCLPSPPLCPPGVEPDPTAGEITCIAKCEFTPQAGAFEIELKYQWGTYDGDPAEPNLDDVRNAPIVVQLDDDDCDGKLTARDIPEIVVMTTPVTTPEPLAGDLVAISIINDQVVEKYRVADAMRPYSYLAAGNIDGVAGNEIVGCAPDGKAKAYTVDPISGAAPTVLWTSPDLGGTCSMPSLADLDQDGQPEVVTRWGILDGKTGAIKTGFTNEAGTALSTAGQVIVSDVDGDGYLDILSGRRAFDRNGVLIADTGVSANWAAIGDLDDPPDGKPEIIGIDSATHTVHIWRYDPTQPNGVEMIRTGVDLNAQFTTQQCQPSSAGATKGGGPPTLADVNADGVPDVPLASGEGYVVLDGKKLMDASVANVDVFHWSKTTRDCSSAQTGSSVFDFNGDNKAEVLYGDEQKFRIYNGEDGAELFAACNTNGTIYEYPVVADVDNNGEADVVVVSNARHFDCGDTALTRTSGIRIYSSTGGDFVRTRRIWNQHAYHITNIGEDGTIPTKELPNWTQPGLNNFRQNKQPGSEFAAPDLVVTIEPRCGGTYRIVARVQNLGEAPVPPGASVELSKNLSGTITSLSVMQTETTLYPAQSELLTFDVGTDAELLAGSATAQAVVTAPATVTECRTGNNESPDTIVLCDGPK